MTENAESCADLNQSTENDPDRVGIIADRKPNCACEAEPFSQHSPSLVDHGETIVRMVCVPMHVHLKRLEIKTSFFSHMATVGASVQRLDCARDDELATCVTDLIAGGDNRVWLGAVSATAGDIRALQPHDGKQSFCVLDAGLHGNQAHAEIHSSWRIPEADQMEYRVALRDLFVHNGVQARRELRGGTIWNLIPEEMQNRPVPTAWSSIA